MGLIVRRGTRKLCNLKEVAEEGARVGFRVELVAFEEMDIYEQIKATTRFHFFVAVHGTPNAGLYAALFEKHSAKLWVSNYPVVWYDGRRRHGTQQ